MRWLPKDGSELDPVNFRGIVLTSTIGNLRARAARAAHGMNAERPRRATSAGRFERATGVHHQVHLVHGAAAARAAGGESTWIVLVDITRAFPSTTRSFVWSRLRAKGMGGAALRAIDALFVNTARLSVGGGVGYTDAVHREIGVPEGYVFLAAAILASRV